MTVRRLGGMLAALAIVVAACGSSSPAGAGSAAPGASSRATLPSLAAGGGGTCSVKITGGMTASWESPQNAGSLLISYWLSQADRTMLSLGANDAYMLMNCQSDTGSISLTTANQTTADQFPEKPGTYVIGAGGLLGGGNPGEIQALVVFHDNSLWKVTQAGSLTVTTFDAGHFAGAFTLQIGQESDDLSTIVVTATISGTFALGCTGSVCG